MRVWFKQCSNDYFHISFNNHIQWVPNGSFFFTSNRKPCCAITNHEIETGKLIPTRISMKLNQVINSDVEVSRYFVYRIWQAHLTLPHRRTATRRALTHAHCVLHSVYSCVRCKIHTAYRLALVKNSIDRSGRRIMLECPRLIDAFWIHSNFTIPFSSLCFDQIK